MGVGVAGLTSFACLQVGDPYCGRTKSVFKNQPIPTMCLDRLLQEARHLRLKVKIHVLNFCGKHCIWVVFSQVV